MDYFNRDVHLFVFWLSFHRPYIIKISPREFWNIEYHLNKRIRCVKCQIRRHHSLLSLLATKSSPSLGRNIDLIQMRMISERFWKLNRREDFQTFWDPGTMSIWCGNKFPFHGLECLNEKSRRLLSFWKRSRVEICIYVVCILVSQVAWNI